MYGEAGFASALEQMFSLIGNVILFVSIIVIVSQLNILLIAGFIAVALLNAYFSSKTRKRANQFDIEKAPLERKICITEAFSVNTATEKRSGSIIS